MGALTVDARNALLDHIYKAGYAPPADIYLALFIGDPLAAGTEVDADTYERPIITFNAAANRRVTQAAEVAFPAATASWGGDISHYALYSAQTGGTRLGTGAFSESFPVVDGNTPKIPTGECWVQIGATPSGAGLTTYAANKLLDLMFNGTPWATPKDTLYFALSRTAINDADVAAPADFTEESGSGYSRTQLLSASMDAAAAAATENNTKVDLASPTASDWGEFVSIALMDAATNGNIIGYDSAVTAQTPLNGDPVEIAIGGWVQTLTAA
jgi:hypothetical protein